MSNLLRRIRVQALVFQLKVLSALILTLMCAVTPAPAAEPGPWMVYYSNQLPLSAFNDFNFLVLDSDSHPPLPPLTSAGKTVVGYLSIGEVENYRQHYKAVRKEGILLQENPTWKGSYFVDLRDPRWTKRVLDELVPKVLSQGFDGIFLDTLDNAAELERINPRRYKGMKDAAIDLVRQMRKRYPSARIVMNRGYDLLPQLAITIDVLLGESVYHTYDFEKKLYLPVPHQDYLQNVSILKTARDANPNLRIFTLDYCDPAANATLRQIYQAERANGFEPYVATIELDRIVSEPIKEQ